MNLWHMDRGRCALRRKTGALRRWEYALILSLGITLFHGALWGGTGAAWWGVVFPGLAWDGTTAQVEAGTFPQREEVRLRLWLLDALRGLAG